MSTLWTPGGEIPVDRNPWPGDSARADGPGGSGEGGEGGTSGGGGGEGGTSGGGEGDPDGAAPEVDLDSLSPEEREQAEQMIHEMAEARERLLAMPAASVVANHAMGLYELAALHLTRQPPNFSEAVVAIDAMGAVTAALAGRLGEAEPTLHNALDQIRKAYVQLKSGGRADTDPAGPADPDTDPAGPADPDTDPAGPADPDTDPAGPADPDGDPAGPAEDPGGEDKA